MRCLISLVLLFSFAISFSFTEENNSDHDNYLNRWSQQGKNQNYCPGEKTPTDGWSSTGLLKHLTQLCRYNKQKRPPSHGPNIIQAKVYIYFLKAHTSYTLQFQAQILLQLQWNDSRLNFENYNTSIDALLGEKYLMNSIWLPHVFLSNEKDSLVMGFLRKDDFVIIHRNGLVLFTTRLKTRVSCQMDVGKFPFDVQKCALIMESWRYASDDLILKWDPDDPVVLRGGVNLTEFNLITWETSSKFNNSYSSVTDIENNSNYSTHKITSHNYSSLILTFTLAREYGFYIMDYYIPSVLIVILSWVSFWLTPDALPARINLGSSTMLTFLQLGWTGAGMPKLSQFQYNTIWEVVCTLFIFLTLVEFAFVNTIHRAGYHKVPLKKPTSKYILKSSLAAAPKPPRIRVRRTSSCPSSPEVRKRFQDLQTKPRHKVIEELSVSDLASQLKSKLEEEKSKMEKIEEDKPLRRRKVSVRIDISAASKSDDEIENESKNRAPDPLPNQSPVPKRRRYSILPPRKFSVQFSMSNHEIAKWIDEKSRIVFPTAFFIFCLFYWSFLWI